MYASRSHHKAIVARVSQMPDWRPMLKSRSNGIPRIMGVLNVTPDSFHINSRVKNSKDAISRALEMYKDGADWIDIGGESTRPGAQRVSSDEELDRVIPTIKSIRDRIPDLCISIDTSKAIVAAKAIEAGADMINDISSLSDPEMGKVIMDYGSPVCLMHMQGIPENMQNNPNYVNTVNEVRDELSTSVNKLLNLGVNSESIIVDPGIGFGKNLNHNIELLIAGREIVPNDNISLLWGVSRKSIFRELLGRDNTDDRLPGTLGVAAISINKGVDIVRVHDVQEHSDLFKTMHSLMNKGNVVKRSANGK